MITIQDSDDMFDLFYTPPHKLVRRDDPLTSHEAAESVDTSHMEQVVLEAIQDFGSDGCISDQVLAKLSHHGYSCLLYTSPSPRDRQKSRMPSSA